MPLDAYIKNGIGKPYRAEVSQLGQLITAPLEYDQTQFNELTEVDTAYNFYEPQPNKQFVITGAILVADKQVSSSVSATVVIYEGDSDSSTTVGKVLIQTAMVQDQVQTLLPLNILVAEGVWINGKTSDDDIHMTIFGYYIPRLTDA